MIQRNHYERSFEAFLRAERLAYIAVNETRRCNLDDEPVKSLDFVVSPRPESQLLIDIKGRKFPGGSLQKPSYCWQSWCTREDVDGLLRWQTQYGPTARGLLVFMYALQPTVDLPLGTDGLWIWKKRRYLLRAVEVGCYREAMRTRSDRWGTVHLRTADYRERVRPLSDWLLSPIEGDFR